MRQVFVDTSGFIASYLETDDFYDQARLFLSSLSTDVRFTTTNFILDETYTYLRDDAGIEKAVKFAKFISSDLPELKSFRVLVEDEKKAWKYFKKLPVPIMCYRAGPAIRIEPCQTRPEEA